MEVSYKDYADFTPNIVWMCILLVTGIVGNSLVLLVYGTRMRTALTDRYFIPILAFLDLLASILSSLHGLLNYLFYLSYSSDIMCKFFNFSSFYTSALSAQALLLIAIQRYRKVCVPFGKQMTLFWKRLSAVISTIVAFVYSAPILYTSGILHWKRRNATTPRWKTCAIDADSSLFFNQLYFCGIFVIMVTNVVAVTVLYSKIGCFIYRRGRKQIGDVINKTRSYKLEGIIQNKSDDKFSDSENVPSTDSSSVSAQGNQAHAQLGPKGLTIKLVNFTPPSTNAEHSILSPGPTKTDDTSKLSASVKTDDSFKSEDKKKNKWDNVKVNFNKMFGAIVIFYLLSYIPTFIVLIGLSFGKFYTLDANLLYFMNRMYIVNHVVNPFVYGYFDVCFRHALVSLFKCGKWGTK